MPIVDEQHLTRWRETGWLAMRGALPAAIVERTTVAVEQVASCAARASEGEQVPGLHHWEMTDHGPALARSEDLVGWQHYLRSLICEGFLVDVASDLLGEPAILYKEKINYKQPGGAGFAPHQDATAYRFVDHHVSCMVPIDPATSTSGCLSVVSGRHDGLLPTEPGGRIEATFAEGLDWEVAEVEPGDVLWFDSYTPHRSGTNSADGPRRALYLTYNAASAGDFRDTYYADKRAEFVEAGGTFGAERVRLSISDDFLGRPVPGR